MGIRFSCHDCGKSLNIKTELAGRRGVCPECGIRFRIPLSDAEFSTPLEESSVAGESVAVNESQRNQEAPVSTPASAATPSSAAAAAISPVAEADPNTASGDAANSSPVIETDGVAQAEPETADDAVRQSAIDLLSNDESSTWYVRPPSGGQYGPATSEVLKSWIDEGRVAKSALLWRDGWPQWREASEALPELAETLPGTHGKSADSVFAEGTPAKRQTTSLASEKTSPIFAGGSMQDSSVQSPLQSISPNSQVQGSVPAEFTDDALVNATRKKRSSRRLTLVAVLATLVVGLIITLILVASTGSG